MNMPMKHVQGFVWLALILMLLALAVITGLLGYLVYVAKSHHPDWDGVIRHASLVNEVRVVRDDWAVPHIEATCETDAFFALGYCMAQDRLFQLELWRRVAGGELAELLGPSLVNIDKIARAFHLRHHAQRSITETLSKRPEIMAALEAYVKGINLCIEKGPLPFEFTALQIPARPFTVEDCLAVGALLPVSFSDALREDVLCTMLKELCPGKDIDSLFPGYSKEIPVTIMETLEEAADYQMKAQRPAVSAARNVQKTQEGLLPYLAGLKQLSNFFGPAWGSNSWVLASSRSKSGKPILANDPHIGFTSPGIWYEAHLQYGTVNNYGYYAPLIPFPLIGQNNDCAWGLTMFANDDTDFYRETFQPGNPFKVMYKGVWADVETAEETIKVRLGTDQHYTVRVTPHGPVITDLFRLIHGYDGPDISMYWVWQHVNYTDMVAFYDMPYAHNTDDFAQAVSLITSPGINVSCADKQGNIAWWAGGRLLVRPEHVNPKQVLDGASGNDDPLGFVPFEQNPHLVNPPCGFIVTANNLSTVKPVGPILLLPGYWQPSDRAGRMEKLLEQQPKWSLEDLKAVQLDDYAPAADGIIAHVLEALGDGPLSAYEQQALYVLCQWDRRHGVDSNGAAIYQVLCSHIMKDALEDEMGQRLYNVYGSLADSWNFFKYFMGDAQSAFWDNVQTTAPETRHDIVLAAFKETVTELEQRLGSDIKTWRWGALHTMEFKHPIGYLPVIGKLFNVGPFPSPGAAETVNNMLYFNGGQGIFDVIAGPSTRRLIDMAAPDHSLTVLPTGNAGTLWSAHFDDQAALFMTGQYREYRFTAAQISAHQANTLTLQPAK
jgi:penicillin G amidase